MKKMIPGSILKNISNLTQGSTQDQISDRSMQLLSSAKANWSGTVLQATADIEIHLQLDAGGSLAINSLPAASYTFTNANDLLIVNLSRASGTTPLISGTYPGLAAGEYAIVNESSLNANDLLRKDHVIMFRRTDFGASKFLHIPLHKETITQGFSYFPVTNPPDIYTVDLHDPVSATLPTGISPIIDGVTIVDGTRVLFSSLTSGANEVYEASNVAVSTNWTAIPLFGPGSVTPSNADYLKVLSGDFYSRQFGEFNSTSNNWSFNDTVRYFNTAGDYYEQSSLRYEPIVASSTNEVFRVAYLNSENIFVNYAIVRNGTKRAGQIIITHNGINAEISDINSFLSDVGVEFSAVISGSDVVLSYTADASGPNGSMRYYTTRISDQAGGPSGIPQYEPYTTVPVGNLQTAFAMSDGSGIEVNCATPYVSGGKTRLDLTFTYTMAVNPGTTGGHLEVIVDGLVLPRYMAGVTLDAYYSEIDNNTIEFNTDYTSPAVSVEVRIRQGTIDTSTSNAYKLAALYNAIVGSASDLTNGAATHTTIASAISAISSGGNILLLDSYTGTENVTITKPLTFEGQGYSSVINGTLVFNAASLQSLVKYVKIVGNITFNSSSANNILTDCWQTNAATITDSGTNNLYTVTGV